MKRFFRIIDAVYRRIYQDKITIYAGQATLFIIISALPFLMLAVSLLRFVFPQSQSQVELLSMVSTFLPVKIMSIINKLVDEIYTRSTLSITSITSIAALWAASKGIMSLLVGMDNIYHLQRGYILSRFLSVVYTIVFIVLLCVTFLMFGIGDYFTKLPIESFPITHIVSNALVQFPTMVYLFIMTIMFALLYKWLPGQKIKFLYQLPGALFSAGGWTIFSKIYNFYAENISNYSLIYGSLTAIVLLMLWLYFCMNLFLFGAEINQFLTERINGRKNKGE